MQGKRLWHHQRSERTAGFFAQALYQQLILQHINYYTPMSLYTLAQRADFIVEELKSDDAEIEMNLYCRKPGVSVSMNERRAQERSV